MSDDHLCETCAYRADLERDLWKAEEDGMQVQALREEIRRWKRAGEELASIAGFEKSYFEALYWGGFRG
jgi:hypothetical protein